jgi:ParB family transcriptional regulator, chromosome partitioning protein
LSESDQAELDQLTAEYDALADDEDANSERLGQIEQRIDELNGSAETWPATLGLAGAVVGLDYEGSLRIERGLRAPYH